MLALFLAGIGLAGLAYSMVSIPNPNDLAKAQASIIYFADGKTELDRPSGVNRESVPLSKVPKGVQHAVIAAEDRDFYQNGGISVSGIGRAVVGALKGRDAGGGSTITQQYVKNYFLTQDQTMERKGKEIIISIKIDRELTKDQILENYLNTVYYGRNSYGIQTAAKSYFGKDISEITVGEGALIATIINQPSRLDPNLSPAAAKAAEERWNYVMDGMVQKGWLSQAERSKQTFPKVIAYKPKQALGGTNGYLVQAVMQELRDRGIPDQQIRGGGIRVVSTIDPSIQAMAVKSVEDNKPTQGKGAGVRIGVASIKPGDGAILAIYGGSDFLKQEYNNATQAHMQAGSTMKAFTTLAALQQGISTKATFDSSTPLKIPGEPKPIQNWDFAGHGMVDIKQMLAGSINTAFVRLNEKVGPESTLKAALAAGLPPENGEGDARTIGLQANIGNVLGSAAARPLDMANAYATIAAQGMRARPYIVKSVTAADGRVLLENKPELTKAFEKDQAADATNALQAVVQPGGTASAASSLGRPAAGKTGTSTDSKSAWFAGYTPQVSTAIGMELPGPDGKTPQSMTDIPSLGSGELPVKIWTAFTSAYLQGKPVEEFPPRAGIGDDKVMPTSTPTFQPTTPVPTVPVPTAPVPSQTRLPEPTYTRPPRPTFTVPTIPGGDSVPPPGNRPGGPGSGGFPIPPPQPGQPLRPPVGWGE
ncbi:Penicillin-binding protein 1A [Austwickia sp. TVS 96-490-7B]|nr:Penicillin-binding protein 1A [Austwickia sp. TVS 96-490-7B]